MRKTILPFQASTPPHLPALVLPVQKNISRTGAPLRSRTLTRWAAELPLGNTSVAAHLVLSKLRELNQARYSMRDRLELHNVLRPLLADLAHALREPLQQSCLPLPPTQQYNASLLQELLEEMSCGYKLVVNQLAMTPRLREYDQFLLQESMYLAIVYLSQRLLDAYGLYMIEPTHVWMDLNQLYQHACLRDMQHGMIDDPYPNTTLPMRPTIDAVYKRILLVALAEPYHLMQFEAEDLYRQVAANVRDCVLEPFSELITQGEYVIDLDADQGPCYITTGSEWLGSDPRLIDIAQVKSQLNKQLQSLLRNNIHGADLEAVPLIERQQRDMLLRLADAWNASLVRKNQRFKLEAQVELAAGLNASHYFISERAGFTPEVDALKLTHDLDKLDDAKHSVFAAVYRDALQKDRRHASRNYQLHTWRQNNVSPLGIALNCEESGQQLDAGVGELVCYRVMNKRLQRWQLGVIRWLRTRYDEAAPGNIDIGVLNLATGAIPIGIKAIKGLGNGTDYFRGLLIPRQVSLQQTRSLLVPALMFDVGTVLVINMKQRLLHARLTRVMRCTRAFTQFDFEVVPRPMDFIL